MGKTLAGVAIGFFIGGFVVEIIRRSDPNWLKRKEQQLGEFVTAAKDAFLEGYNADASPEAT